jgi:hypothetical protein
MNNLSEKKMRTKNKLLLLSIVILAIILAACSGTSNQTNKTSSNTGTAEAKTGTSLSQVNMLLVGMLKLEGTDKAVTSDEAVKLLPLWQAYRSLSTSQTAAEAEVEALLNQIQSIMTSDQVVAIKALNLTSKDMMDLIQSMGGAMGPQGTPNPQSTPGVNTTNGGFPSGNAPNESAGGPPSGSNSAPTRKFPSGGGAIIVGGGPGGDAGSAAGLGGGPMLQSTQDPSMQATAQAKFSTQANQVNTILLDVLINKLEAKTTG